MGNISEDAPEYSAARMADRQASTTTVSTIPTPRSAAESTQAKWAWGMRAWISIALYGVACVSLSAFAVGMIAWGLLSPGHEEVAAFTALFLAVLAVAAGVCAIDAFEKSRKSTPLVGSQKEEGGYAR